MSPPLNYKDQIQRKGGEMRWNTIWRETVASHMCSLIDQLVFSDTRCWPWECPCFTPNAIASHLPSFVLDLNWKRFFENVFLRRFWSWTGAMFAMWCFVFVGLRRLDHNVSMLAAHQLNPKAIWIVRFFPDLWWFVVFFRILFFWPIFGFFLCFTVVVNTFSF